MSKGIAKCWRIATSDIIIEPKEKYKRKSVGHIVKVRVMIFESCAECWSDWRVRDIHHVESHYLKLKALMNHLSLDLKHVV